MTGTCDAVRELLPWRLNRSLTESERASVDAHLAGCSSCRAEAEATARVAWIHERHVPVGALTEYAFGAELTGPERSALERHLAHCGPCREELSAAQAVAGLRLDRTPGSSGPAWWALAVAASLVIGLLGTGLWWFSPSTNGTAPTGDVAVVELLPESFDVRGPAGEPVVPESGAVTLVLVTDLVLEDEVYRARLLTSEMETLWEVSDLRPSENGTFVIHLPNRATLVEGSSILLEVEDDGEWRSIESYRLGR